MLIWLDNPPEDWDSEEGRAFIDQNVSCSYSNNFHRTVEKYQKHDHTATCYKNKDKNRNCRFHFPIQPSDETKVLGDDEIRRNGGKFIQLKRTTEEAMINNYHPILLQILRCNMDISPVTTSMAIAYYIAK